MLNFHMSSCASCRVLPVVRASYRMCFSSCDPCRVYPECSHQSVVIKVWSLECGHRSGVIREPAASIPDFMVTARIEVAGLVVKVITPFGSVVLSVLLETLIAEAVRSVETAFDADAESIG